MADYYGEGIRVAMVVGWILLRDLALEMQGRSNRLESFDRSCTLFAPCLERATSLCFKQDNESYSVNTFRIYVIINRFIIS
jgi:hypothetical protein